MNLGIVLEKEKLEQLQAKRRLSDADLASLASLNPSQIWRVKEGKCGPGPKFIAGILSVFPGKKFNDLFSLAQPLQARQDKDLPKTGTSGE